MISDESTQKVKLKVTFLLQPGFPPKGEVGNAIINTKSKTGLPPLSVCKKYTGVN